MLKNIFKSIDEKVRLEIERIKNEKDEAILALSRDYEKKLTEKYQKERELIVQKTEREITETEKDLELRFRFAIQRIKHQILQETYQAALVKLNRAEDGYLKKIIVKMVELLPPNMTGQIRSGKRTAQILKPLLSGRPIVVSDDLGEEGFLAIASNFEIDLRFSQALKQKKDKMDPGLLKILFA